MVKIILKDKIYTIRNFLSDEECEIWICGTKVMKFQTEINIR